MHPLWTKRWQALVVGFAMESFGSALVVIGREHSILAGADRMVSGAITATAAQTSQYSTAFSAASVLRINTRERPP
jgi:pyruvate/2-oxoglutarate dehydrogenase complex dihydrolipoamide dehydrogenase (E3) component